MANHSSSSSTDPQKPHKQIDLSLLLEISTKLGIPRKLSDLINNNKSSTNTNNSEKDSNPQKFGDFQPINRYHFPNCYDKDEIGLPCLEHCLFRFQWQSNFSSPIEQRLLSGDNRILDVGCGQGAWILDMAKEYHPTNTYIGIDILPDFPDEDLRLPNTGFIQCDFRCGIPFPDSTFDFVYERFVVYSDLTDAQWKYLFSEMKRVLKPGGYLEIMEYHAGYENPGPITQIRNAEVLEYLNSKGIDPDVTIGSINQMMQSTPSLTDFQRQDKFGPIGRWGGEFGLIMLESYEMSRKALSRQFKSGLMEIELDDLIESITKEFDENKTKLGNFRCFAQKRACFLYD